MINLTIIQTIAVWIIPVLLAITLHEAAHAWMASRCGDLTAKHLGRLSANPLRHMDWVGTVLVPIFVGVMSGFQYVFGWAKPVPVNWHHLRKPRRDMALVAVAGPFANVVMAFLWAICAKTGGLVDPEMSQVALYLVYVGEAGIVINLLLGLVNLIPIPPLDGSRLIASILPKKLFIYYMKLEPFGFYIIFLLLFTGFLGWLIRVPMSWCEYFIHWLFSM